MTSEERVIAAELREMRDAVSTFGVVDSRDEAGPAVLAFDVVARLTLAADTIEALATALETARPVLEHVSRGRGYADVTPYPDATARRALGLLEALHPQRPDEIMTSGGAGKSQGESLLSTQPQADEKPSGHLSSHPQRPDEESE